MTIRTIRCKLLVSSEVDPLFLATQEAFTYACNAILAKALEANVKDPIQLHHLMYTEVRTKFGLSANLAVRAIRRVAASLSQKKKKRPKPKANRSR